MREASSSFDRDNLRVGSKFIHDATLMTYDEAIARLAAYGSSTTDGKCWHCPAHDDHRPSLSVSEGEDGQLLMNCHYGCEFEDVLEVLREVDLTLSGFPTPSPRDKQTTSRKAKARSPIPSDQQLYKRREDLQSDTHTVRNAEQYRKIDFETLEQHRVGVHRRNGQHCLSLEVRDAGQDKYDEPIGVISIDPRPSKDVRAEGGLPQLALGRRGLFPAPEAFDSKEIVIVEGEMDALAVNSLGVDAVGVPGANNWQPEWAQRFERFEKVTVISDCDNPGRKCAQEIAHDLSKVTNVSILDLDPECDDGRDIGDYIMDDKGVTKEDLELWIMSSAKPLETPPGLLGQEMTLDIFRAPLPMSYLSTPTLGEKLFYEYSMFSVAGHPGSGKSMVLLAAAIDHVRAGKHVAYVDFENGQRRVEKRLWTLDARSVEGFQERFHYFPKPDMSLKDFTRDLEAVGNTYPEVFVVIDSLRGLMTILDPGQQDRFDMNAQMTIEKAEGPIMKVVQTHKMTVGIIDHSTKTGSEYERYASSGSGAKQAVVDVEYFWSDEEHFSKEDIGVAKLTLMKDRDGELQKEHYWSLGGNGDGPLVFEALDAEDYKEAIKEGRRAHRVQATRSRISDAILGALDKGQLTLAELRVAVKGDNGQIGDELKALVEEGVVEKARDGKNSFYRLVADDDE
jgi:hypothetical protein